MSQHVVGNSGGTPGGPGGAWRSMIWAQLNESLETSIPGPSKGCPMNYPTLPIGFHWAPLGGSWYNDQTVFSSTIIDGPTSKTFQNQLDKHYLVAAASQYVA